MTPAQVMSTPYLFKYINPVTPGEHEIKKYAVIVINSDFQQCLLKGEGLFAEILLAAEIVDNAVGQLLLVLDNQ